MKKLIPAFALLLISAVVLSTASFAWFSMNTEVSASGMTITAKSDAVALVINSTNTAGSGGTTETTAVSGTLLPTAHNALTNKAAADTVGNWYTKVADAPTASASTGDATALTEFTGYVVSKTVYISMATGSNPTTDLIVKGVTITKDSGTATNLAPVRVVIASAAGVVEYKYGASGATLVSGTNTALAAQVTATECIAVTIYVYYDGNDDSVYTNVSNNIAGASIAVDFSVTAPNAGA